MENWDALADEFGLISAQSARVAGCSRRDLARLTKSDQWTHLTRGWYALTSALTPAEDDSPAERRRLRHALLARANVSAFDGRALASHHSALVLYRLPIFAADLNQVHVTRASDDHSRVRSGLSIHEQVHGAAHDGRVIEPAVAVVQTGMVNGPMAALIAADAALRQESVHVEDLERAVALLGGPKIPAVQRALQHADARAESPGETRLREAVRLMGYRATPQVSVRDGSFVAVVDLMLDDVAVAIEFDGFVKYGRTNPKPGRIPAGEVVFAEKVREDHIRELRHAMVRVMWAQLDDLVTLRRRIDAAAKLARALRAA